jgi:hypothetical protein
MKKLIAIAVVFALVAGAVFAQDEEAGTVKPGITISGGAGATFVPFILGGPVYDKKGGIEENFKIGAWGGDPDWEYIPVGDPAGRSEIFTGIAGYGVNVNVNGSSEFAGFSLGLNLGGVSGGSFWVAPLGSNALKFTFDGSLTISSNDLVPGLGISLKLPNLVDVGNKINATTDYAVPATFADAWRQVQVSVGYAIPDIGSFSVGYNGGWAEPINFNTPTDYQLRYLYKNGEDFPGMVGSVKVPKVDVEYGTSAEVPEKAAEFGIWDRLVKGPDAFSNSIPYGSANFTAGFNLSALQSIGLGLGINAKLFLPQSGEFKHPDSAIDVSVKRENSAWTDLGLNVSYKSGDFSIGLNFGATQLGKSTTLTYAGSAAGLASISSDTILNGEDDNKSFSSVAREKGSTKKEEMVKMSIDLTPRYVIDGTTIGVDIGATFTSESRTIKTGFEKTGDNDPNTTTLNRDSEAQYKFGAFVKFKPFGKATLQVGINVETPKLLTAPGANKLSVPLANTQPIPGEMKGTDDHNNSRFFISVPISFSVSF